MSYGKWLEFIQTSKGFISTGNGATGEIFYIQPGDNMVICVIFSQVEMERILNQEEYTSHFFICNTQGDLVSYGERVKPEELAGRALFYKNNGMFDTKSTAVFYTKMEQAPFVIGLQMPARIYKNSNLLWLTLLIVFLCIAVSFVLIYYLAKKNVRPVTRLIRLFSGKEEQRIDNAYDYIYQEAQHTLSENRMIEQRLSSQTELLHAQRNMMQKMFFDRLLSGETRGILSLTDSMAQGGLAFQSYHFCVVIFYLEQASTEIGQQGENDILSQLSQQISTAFQQLGQTKYRVFMHEFHHMMIAILNFSQDSVPQNLQTALEQDIENVLKALEADFTVAVGDVCQSMDQICISYQHAFLALENKNEDRETAVVWYDNFKDTLSPMLYYPFEREQMLVVSLKEGDEIEALERFHELWNKNIAENGSSRYSRLMVLNLINIILKVCYELETSRNLEILQHVNVDEALYTMPSRQVYETLKETVHQICSVIQNEKKGGRSQAIVKQIFNYIDQNFWNPHLSITMIGEQFGFSPYYLSRVVKEEYPEGVMHYVHSKRMEMAKRLLREGEKSIDEIVELTGYTNRTSFTRIFKKFEHIPPSKYR